MLVCTPVLLQYVLPYSANFRGRKLSRIGGKYDFQEKTFADCLLVLSKNATSPNFIEKTFTNSHKTLKVFSLENFMVLAVVAMYPAMWD